MIASTTQKLPTLRQREDTRRKSAWRERGRLYLVLYLLLAPTLVGTLLFNYYPKFDAIRYSLYDWDGQQNKDFIGFKNFADLFAGRDPLFAPTFKLVGILLVANLIKMWPSIFTAIAVHRLKSEKWQYLYRVLFVIPMVIPGLVWLLIWKQFFDPSVGILNTLLNATGLMQVLNSADVVMPKIATALQHGIVGPMADPAFSSVWGMLVFGAVVLSCTWDWKRRAAGWVWWGLLLLTGWMVVGPVYLAGMLVMGVLLGELRRLAAGVTVMKWIGGLAIAGGCLLIALTKIWDVPTSQFADGTPSWLSHEKLVIPALVIWGFPWVGSVGVLIYLSGLQAISQDVYEAAELDGVGSVGRIFKIELPLMMTQVRINLIFMTISTLTDYGLILLLLGPSGGPKNVGMVPGLYMYSKAFIDAQFGYACALGMVMFVLILLITILYQKYVKVEK